MKPLLSLINAMDKADGYAKRLGYLAERPAFTPQAHCFPYIFVTHLGQRVLYTFWRSTSVRVLSPTVLLSSNPFKVFWSIIKAIRIEMVHRHSWIRDTMERFCNKAVRQIAFSRTIAFDANSGVPITGYFAFQDVSSPRLRVLALPCAGRGMRQGLDAPKAGSLRYAFKRGDIFPYFHGLALQDIQAKGNGLYRGMR